MAQPTKDKPQSGDGHFPYLINVTESFLRTLIPLAAISIVVFLMQALLNSKTTHLDYLLTIDSSPKEMSPNSQIIKYFAWTSSALVYSSLFIATITLSLYTIRQIVKEYKLKNLIFLLVLIVTIIFSLLQTLPAIWSSIPRLTDETMVVKIMHMWILENKKVLNPEFAKIQDFLAWWEVQLLLISFCLISSPLNKDIRIAQNQLWFRKRLASLLLYMGAVSLTIGVVQLNLLFRLPGNAVALGISGEQLETIATGVSMVSGSFFSLLLLAMFVPVAIILNSETYKIAANSGNANTIEKVNLWIKDNDLDGSTRQQASRLIAILGPLIAGWIGEPVAKGLMSLFGQ